MLVISSSHNEHVKRIKKIQQKARVRKNEQLFCIEGIKEIKSAIAAGYTLTAVYVKAGSREILNELKIETTTCHAMESFLFEQLCFRKTSRLLCLAEVKAHSLDQLKLPEVDPFLLIAEAPEKPGNIGALLRTADALGADAMLIVSPKTDLYNPNVIRASVGCVFHVPIGMGTCDEVLAFLTQHKITLYNAALTHKAKNYTTVDYRGAVAIAVGTEDQGLSQQWLQHKSTQIYIPMLGHNDSLNVSVAAGIIFAEARRQRN